MNSDLFQWLAIAALALAQLGAAQLNLRTIAAGVRTVGQLLRRIVQGPQQ